MQACPRTAPLLQPPYATKSPVSSSVTPRFLRMPGIKSRCFWLELYATRMVTTDPAGQTGNTVDALPQHCCASQAAPALDPGPDFPPLVAPMDVDAGRQHRGRAEGVVDDVDGRDEPVLMDGEDEDMIMLHVRCCQLSTLARAAGMAAMQHRPADASQQTSAPQIIKASSLYTNARTVDCCGALTLQLPEHVPISFLAARESQMLAPRSTVGSLLCCGAQHEHGSIGDDGDEHGDDGDMHDVEEDMSGDEGEEDDDDDDVIDDEILDGGGRGEDDGGDVSLGVRRLQVCSGSLVRGRANKSHSTRGLYVSECGVESARLSFRRTGTAHRLHAKAFYLPIRLDKIS